MSKVDKVENGHLVVTDPDAVDNKDAENRTEQGTPEQAKTEQVKTTEHQEGNTKEKAKKSDAPVFTLTGAASFLSMGKKFIKNVPTPVEDKKLAERLRKTNLFKEGE